MYWNRAEVKKPMKRLTYTRDLTSSCRYVVTASSDITQSFSVCAYLSFSFRDLIVASPEQSLFDLSPVQLWLAVVTHSRSARGTYLACVIDFDQVT